MGQVTIAHIPYFSELGKALQHTTLLHIQTAHVRMYELTTIAQRSLSIMLLCSTNRPAGSPEASGNHSSIETRQYGETHQTTLKAGTPWYIHVLHVTVDLCTSLLCKPVFMYM